MVESLVGELWSLERHDTAKKIKYKRIKEIKRKNKINKGNLMSIHFFSHILLDSVVVKKFRLMVSSRLMKVKVLVTQSCPTLCDPMDCSLPWLLCPWNSPGKNTRMDCHSLVQGIFTAQGLNPGFLHCREFFTNWATREAQEYWSG